MAVMPGANAPSSDARETIRALSGESRIAATGLSPLTLTP